jgi:DNA (cytosine-5)-methyltransferase 1
MLRALDLFCCAGGAGKGLARAGFDVTGVDIEPQPRYPFRFVQADALTVELDGFDFVWASPMCQRFTAYRRRSGHVAERPDQIPAVREKLRRWGGPYVIENVPGAPLENPHMLCGSMFGLDVQRHRIFECNFPVLAPPCDHSRWTPRFPPATNRTNLRKTGEVGVWRIPLETQQRAMGGLEWMELHELSQAIPPAYSEFLARAWMRTQRKAA